MSIQVNRNQIRIYEDDDIYIKRMSDATPNEINQSWNLGFDDGYTREFGVCYQFPLDAMITRLVVEQYSMKCSVVAYCKQTDKPIGYIGSGVRKLRDGTVMSWNGGTAVLPEYRRKGIGKKLMEVQFDLYNEANVDIATIEVVPQNKKARNLYLAVGFQESNNFLHLNIAGVQQSSVFDSLKSIDNSNIEDNNNKSSYRIRSSSPQEVGKIEFYPKFTQWQAQFENFAFGGEGIIVEDEKTNEIVGYALIKKGFDDNLNEARVSLRQCQVKPDHPDFDRILKQLLLFIIKPECNSMVLRNLYLPPTFPKINEKVDQFLKECGFKNGFDILCLVKNLK